MDFQENVYTYKEAQSFSIEYNNGNIISSQMSVTYTGEGNISLYLSANGGLNWEQVTNGIIYTFINSGTDLRWKIGASGITVTRILIKIYH